MDGEIQSAGEGSLLNLALGAKLHTNCWGMDNTKLSLKSNSDNQATQGWWSPTYGILEPAFSFEMTGTAKGLTRFATAFTFSNSDSVEIHQNKTKIQLKDRTGITIDYSQPSAINTPIKVIISRAGQTESKLTFGDLN